MAINKIIYDGNTLIDLTGDTVSAATLLSGATAHDNSGTVITGACTYDSDTSDATAVVAEILLNKTAYSNGTKLTGTMPNNGAVTGTISTSVKVSISSTEQNKIIAGNIKSGVVILGVTGTYTGAAISAQTKTATPTSSLQTILPDVGYDYLSQVTVNAIPYVEAPNAYGTTVTIG